MNNHSKSETDFSACVPTPEVHLFVAIVSTVVFNVSFQVLVLCPTRELAQQVQVK